jgi:hypothetical protein
MCDETVAIYRNEFDQVIQFDFHAKETKFCVPFCFVFDLLRLFLRKNVSTQRSESYSSFASNPELSVNQYYQIRTVQIPRRDYVAARRNGSSVNPFVSTSPGIGSTE